MTAKHRGHTQPGGARGENGDPDWPADRRSTRTKVQSRLTWYTHTHTAEELSHTYTPDYILKFKPNCKNLPFGLLDLNKVVSEASKYKKKRKKAI